MESYHTSDSLSSREYPDMAVRTVRERSTVGFYCYMVVPPIQRVLDILLATMTIGGCRPPHIRELAEQAEVARGAVTDLLRQLATDGWILYDGRTITLMRDRIEAPDDLIDHVIDQGDDPEEAAVYCTVMHQTIDRDSDRSRDRSESPPAPPMVINITTATAVVDLASTIGGSGGIFPDDRSADRSPPAAQVMAELGANPRIIQEAYQSRPDWTPEQVRQRWAYDQRRIAASDGRLNEGVFFTALRSGELAPVRPDPNRPLDPSAYAGTPGFALGSATDPLEVESIRDRAARLLPPPTAEMHRTYVRDWLFLQGRLGAGDTDDQALGALEKYRSAVRR